MSYFDKAVQFVLQNEGGIYSHPKDRGGPTYFGLRKLYGTPKSPEEATKIYHQHFWKPIYDQIHHCVFAIKIFDTSVHMGHGQCHRLVQRSLQCLGCTIKDDGLFGRITLSNLNQQDDFLPVLIAHITSFYRYLVQKNPDFECFLKGWLKRGFRVPIVI
jgi:lysozyme family protein